MKNVEKIVFKSILLLTVAIFLVNCKSNKTASTRKTHSRSKNEASLTYTPKAGKVIKEARSYLGTRYRYGGMSRSGMDCSGLTCKSYESVGLSLPRSSRAQSAVGKRVYIGELQPGDLIFFATSSSKKKITHVGIVTERTPSQDIKFIHASSSKGVREDMLSQDYWRSRYVKAVRPLK